MAQHENLPVIPVRSKSDAAGKPFGGEWKKEFLLDPTWHNLNHDKKKTAGSFGTYPAHIRRKLREYQDQVEAQPDKFIRYDQPKLLDESREAVAKLVNAPVDTVVFVGNATDGVNTVLRNLAWDKDGKDVILSFSTVYEACGKAADYLVDYYAGSLEHREISITYPLEDEDIIRAFRAAVQQVQADGRRAKLAIFDVVSSRPGVVFPWVEMVKACKQLEVISLVDGAQGIGMVHLDLAAADPDFFVTNCHKWLHVPRGCAMFFTPKRKQHVLRTTLATSHGYTPRDMERTSPLPPSVKSAYVNNFEFVGTRDNGPYLCVKDAIAWRQEVCGGEDRLISYLWDLNKRGIRLVAEALGTEYLDNSGGTLTNCAMGNVALPVWVGEKNKKKKMDEETDVVVRREHAALVSRWISETLVNDYRTFMTLFMIGDRFWVRLSAQIYLDERDYEIGAGILKELCGRVGNGEYFQGDLI